MKEPTVECIDWSKARSTPEVRLVVLMMVIMNDYQSSQHLMNYCFKDNGEGRALVGAIEASIVMLHRIQTSFSYEAYYTFVKKLSASNSKILSDFHKEFPETGALFETFKAATAGDLIDFPKGIRNAYGFHFNPENDQRELGEAIDEYLNRVQSESGSLNLPGYLYCPNDDNLCRFPVADKVMIRAIMLKALILDSDDEHVAKAKTDAAMDPSSRIMPSFCDWACSFYRNWKEKHQLFCFEVPVSSLPTSSPDLRNEVRKNTSLPGGA